MRAIWGLILVRSIRETGDTGDKDEKVTEPMGGAIPRVAIEIFVGDAFRFEPWPQQCEQARLSAAVPAHDADLVATENGEIRAVEQDRGAPAQAQIT